MPAQHSSCSLNNQLYIEQKKKKGCVNMIVAENIPEKQRGNISSLMANREENQGGISSFVRYFFSYLAKKEATWLAAAIFKFR